jgi:branched-chain amino acid transport system permease protein
LIEELLGPLSYTLVNGIVLGALYALMAMGFSMIFGIMKIINFAHGEFYMLGAFFCFFLISLWGINSIVAVLVTMAILFGMGIVIERLLIYPLRRKSRARWLDNSLIMTIGLSIFLQNAALGLWGGHRQGVQFLFQGTVSFLRATVSVERIVIAAFSLLSIASFWLFLQKTSLGRGFRAVSQDREAAELMGINSERVYMLAFGFSAMFAGAAGALLLPILLAYPTVGGQVLFKSFVIVILGGLGSVPGAILAGFMLGLTESAVSTYIGSIYGESFGLAILIIILMIRPTGILGREY